MRLGPLLLALLAAGACGEREKSPEMTAEEVAGELAAMRIEPGLWELTTEVVGVSAPNLPVEVRNRMLGPRTRTRNCISAEQAARPSANFLAGREDSDCTYRDFAMVEGRLRGTMTCPAEDGGGPVTARMDGRYRPESYEMRMVMESPMPTGVTMTLDIRNRGRRIGACPEGGT
jgi:Protein of unknown function (DUF3617)